MTNLVSGRITVGVPTRNRAGLLRRAVESVLSQEYLDVEVIVSDNASTDRTVECMEEVGDPRLRLLRQHENVGMIANFNNCLQNATGEFFLMLSDDDVLEPGALARFADAFHSPPDGIESRDIGLVWCPCTIISAEGDTLWVSDKGPAVEKSASLVAGLLDGSRGPRFSGILVRTTDAITVGGYEPSHGALCDIGNWMRIAVKYPFAVCVPEPLVRYTMHQTSTTSKSTGSEWQEAAENVHRDLLAALRERGDGAGELLIRRRKTAFLTNMIVTVLMQRMGKAGWVRYAFREVLRAPRYFFNTCLVARLIRDGWKLLPLRNPQRARRCEPATARI
jgi:glycosyltransferase involved in cell wall biosynthesis